MRARIDKAIASQVPETGTAIEVIYILIFAWLMTMQLRVAYYCLKVTPSPKPLPAVSLLLSRLPSI